MCCKANSKKFKGSNIFISFFQEAILYHEILSKTNVKDYRNMCFLFIVKTIITLRINAVAMQNPMFFVLETFFSVKLLILKFFYGPE